MRIKMKFFAGCITGILLIFLVLFFEFYFKFRKEKNHFISQLQLTSSNDSSSFERSIDDSPSFEKFDTGEDPEYFTLVIQTFNRTVRT